MQRKLWTRDWMLSKCCQCPDLPQFSLCCGSTLTLHIWNFLLVESVQCPPSYGKLTLKMSMRDRRKLQKRNACHDNAFWQNLESILCWHTFLCNHATVTDTAKIKYYHRMKGITNVTEGGLDYTEYGTGSQSLPESLQAGIEIKTITKYIYWDYTLSLL